MENAKQAVKGVKVLKIYINKYVFKTETKENINALWCIQDLLKFDSYTFWVSFILND